MALQNRSCDFHGSPWFTANRSDTNWYAITHRYVYYDSGTAPVPTYIMQINSYHGIHYDIWNIFVYLVSLLKLYINTHL